MEPKNFNKPPHTSNVGRYVSPDGKDEGDARFIERDLEFTPEVELAELKENQRHRADLALAQVEQIVRERPGAGADAFTDLLALYPDDARAEEWRERINAFSSK